MGTREFNFFRFPTADPIVEAEKLVVEIADRRRKEMSRCQEELQQERFETELRMWRERFETELRDCLKALARTDQESLCDTLPPSGGATSGKG